MKARTTGVFVALALMGGACASDDDSSSGATAGDPRRPGPAVVDDGAPTSGGPSSGGDGSDRQAPDGTAAPAGTEAPAATEVAAETASPAEAGAPADASTSGGPAAVPATMPATTVADGSGPLGYAEDQPQPLPSDEMTEVEADPRSTFALDVDTGSYTYALATLDAGGWPDPSDVRTEEFVNAFEQEYAAPDAAAFAVTMDGTAAPFLDDDRRILRVGIQGREIDDEDRPDANLTFVIDISGSMADPGKLDLVTTSLVELVDSLRPSDRVAIVVYSDDTRVVLAATKVRDRDSIVSVIEGLRTEGSTNVQDGLRLGYEQARSTFEPDRINRVVLLSDGVANVGATGPEAILEIISDEAREGIDLVTVGFGMGQYNDGLMEQLADQGDGFYAYVDDEAEAWRLFTEDLTGTLQVIARDAKVQVTFNPAAVARYRLIGFENRLVADDDFRDDRVDGGEVGAGHTVTALYEVELRPETTGDEWLARTDLRWLDPDTDRPDELSATVLGNDLAARLDDAAPRLRQDVQVAAVAEYLRGGAWTESISLRTLEEELRETGWRLDDPMLEELAEAVDRLRGLD